jgi:uncharacterized protein involved in outer membrane biogenesis
MDSSDKESEAMSSSTPLEPEQPPLSAGPRRGRSWIKLLLVLLVTLVVVIGLGLAWLFTANLGVFKPQIERALSDAIGREVSIGTLDLRLGRTVALSAEEVHLANAAWDEPPDMVRIGRLVTRVDLKSLLTGPIVVELLDVDDVSARLVENDAGAGNWEFTPPDPDADADEQAEAESALPVLQVLEVDDVHVVYITADRPQPMDVRILSLRQSQQPDDTLSVSLSAAVNERDVSLQGTWGKWQALIDGRDLTFEFDGRLDTIALQAAGRIDDLYAPRRPTMQFSVVGPDVTDLSALLGLGEVGQGDINLAGKLEAAQGGPLTLDVQGNLGLSRIDAKGAVSALDDLDNLDLGVTASGPNLGRLLAYLGVSDVGEAPFEVALQARRRGPDVSVEKAVMTFGDSRFDATATIPAFPGLDNAAVNVTAEGQRLEQLRALLGLPGVASGPFSARLTVAEDEGGDTRFELSASNVLAKVDGSGRIGDTDDYRDTEASFAVEILDLQQLATLLDLEGMPAQPASVSGTVVYRVDDIALPKPLKVTTRGVSVAASGSVSLSPGLVGTALKVAVEGPDAADTLQRFGVEADVPSLPYAVGGDLRLQNNGVRVQGGVARLGESRFEIAGLLVPEPPFAGTSVTFSGKGPALEALLAELDTVRLRPGPFETSGEVRLDANDITVSNFTFVRGPARLKMDANVALPLERNRMEVDLSASGPDVRLLFTELAGFEPAPSAFAVNAAVVRDGDRWSFQPLNASLGDAKTQLNGDLVLAEKRISGRVQFSGDIPDVAKLGRYQNRRFVSDALRWSGTVSGTGDSVIVEDLKLFHGDSDLAGRIVYRPAEVPEIEVDLTSSRLVVASLLEPEPSADDAEVKVEAGDDGRLIPDTELPFEQLGVANARFAVQIGELQLGDERIANATARGELRDATLTIDELSFDARDGHVEANAVVAAADGGRVSMSLTGLDLNPSPAPDNPMDADIAVDLEATGATVRALAGSANGLLVVNTAGGQFEENPWLAALYGAFLNELLTTIIPGAEDDDVTRLECAVLAATVVDGVAEGNPSAFVLTNKVRISVASKIDLTTEKIAVTVETRPAKRMRLFSVSEILNPYVKIVGTLAAPALAVDEKGLLISGGAAVATGGLSIVAKGFLDRLGAKSDPCAEAREAARTLVAVQRGEQPPP